MNHCILYLPLGIGILVEDAQVSTEQEIEIALDLLPNRTIKIGNPYIDELIIDFQILEHLTETAPMLYFYGHKKGQTDKVSTYLGMVELERDALLEIKGALKYLREDYLLPNQ